MKKLINLLALLSVMFVPQAESSLADKIAEDNVGWLLGAWETDLNGYSLSLSYKWAVKDHVITSHLKMGDVEGFSVIGMNPQTGEVEQTGYNSQGNKHTGKWEPKGDLPMLIYSTTDDAGKVRSLAVAYRKVDDETIEVQMFRVQDDGKVGDSSEYNFEMKRVKE